MQMDGQRTVLGIKGYRESWKQGGRVSVSVYCHGRITDHGWVIVCSESKELLPNGRCADIMYRECGLRRVFHWNAGLKVRERNIFLLLQD